MKYIIFAVIVSVALSLLLINCARAKYRHPADPHAQSDSAKRQEYSATVSRNSDAEIAHYSDMAERVYIAQMMRVTDSIAHANERAILREIRQRNEEQKQCAMHSDSTQTNNQQPSF